MNKLELIENLKEHYKTILEASRISRGAFKGLSPEEIRKIAKQEEARLDARRDNLSGIGSGLRSDVLKAQAAGIDLNTYRFYDGYKKDFKDIFWLFNASKRKPIHGKKSNVGNLKLSSKIEGVSPAAGDTIMHGSNMGRLAAAKGFGKTGKRIPRY